MFTIMIYNFKGYWDDLARDWGVILGNLTNTIIIVDDIFSFSDDENILDYLS